MRPRNELATTGYGLADPGDEYLVPTPRKHRDSLAGHRVRCYGSWPKQLIANQSSFHPKRSNRSALALCMRMRALVLAIGCFAAIPVGRAEPPTLQLEVDRTPPPPVLPGVNADPHIAVFGDTFYIYPTTDGTEGWLSTSFRGWSSRDLVNWRDEGVLLDLPRDLTWASVRAWAPAIAAKDGRFYYYYSAEQNVGVAVGDTPVGPFQDPLGKPLVAKADFPQMQVIDPMVFVDDDGTAYLCWGQGRCKVVRLNEDMISFDRNDVVDITPPGYNEGPFLHQRNGIYYFTWSEYDTRDPRYSVAYARCFTPGSVSLRSPAASPIAVRGEITDSTGSDKTRCRRTARSSGKSGCRLAMR
jgi:hypothetical protein